MTPYIRLLTTCAEDGVRQANRTGIDTFMLPGGMLQFNLADGFPILTTKRVNFGAVVAELLGFIRGYTSAARFRELGCKIWDKNANENGEWLKNPNRQGEDDLGRIYGAQWRSWDTSGGTHIGQRGGQRVYIDQFWNAVNKIINNPQDRRIIVSAWNPGELDRMSLPPCHLLYQFLVEQQQRKLHMTMYMRSCDMFLGVPFNISSYALLLHIVALATGLRPGTLTMFLADMHVYENHLAQVAEQVRRQPQPLPVLKIAQSPFTVGVTANAVQFIESLIPSDFSLEGYEPHPAIKAEMAV